MTVPLDSQTGHAGAYARELVASYRSIPGVFDEMVDEAGRLRDHWRPLVDALARLGPGAVEKRFALADQHLASSGAFYRVYDDADRRERPYLLSHVPLVLSASDWATITAGLEQRATILEALLSDAYGPRDLVASRSLPAAMLAGSPEYLRPLVGINPLNGRHLSFYAADIGRAPDGRWWVLRDRTQAPSGSGYALQNRIAMSHALGEITEACAVEPLVGYFDDIRATLSRYRTSGDAGVAILTPGSLNETYFEHIYLSRQLGFRLVEGQDLVVENKRLWLRTVGGLRPINVLLRRIDSDFADPVELNTGSRLGIPGLIDALRAGTVTIANALGSGLAEAAAFMSFMPALATRQRGEELLLPNVATWWCGQPAEREFVLDNLDRLNIASAFAPAAPDAFDYATAKNTAPKSNDARIDQQRTSLRHAISRRGIDYVAHERVQLSTMPIWSGSKFEARPFVLRVYLAQTNDGWHAMPGGLALVGDARDTGALTMQRGAHAADVWVTAGSTRTPADAFASKPPEMGEIRRSSGSLPSRAADCLFWLARYLERAEGTVRIIRALANRAAEALPSTRPERAALMELLFQWGAIPDPQSPPRAIALALTDPASPGSVSSLVSSALASGQVIRNRFPIDAWRALQETDIILRTGADEALPDGGLERAVDTTLRNLAAIAGLQLESMNRLSGWRFMKLGGRIERAILVSRLARSLALAARSNGCLDALLELNDCQITYRMRYAHGAVLKPVFDLVLLDESNPRSLAFSIERIEHHLDSLVSAGDIAPHESPRDAQRELAEAFRAVERDDVGPDQLIAIENRLMRLSDEITAHYFDLSGAPRDGAR
ncbi:MAG: circularly permuted type 2 ATP-grasp protein [Hyphomicrobium sp.]|nr:circularly permuted type 2 ATP-grasp protein [Hyphomicrobium sp.]